MPPANLSLQKRNNASHAQKILRLMRWGILVYYGISTENISTTVAFYGKAKGLTTAERL